MYGSTVDSAGAAPRRGSSRGAARAARESYGKLVAFLAAKNRDVPGPEDALADAFAGRPRWRNRPE
jgi:RNA polymerase sigma-70 factor (ECF subfamily)